MSFSCQFSSYIAIAFAIMSYQVLNDYDIVHDVSAMHKSSLSLHDDVWENISQSTTSDFCDTLYITMQQAIGLYSPT